MKAQGREEKDNIMKNKTNIQTRLVAVKLIKSGVIASLLASSACSANIGKGAFSNESGRILIDADEKGLRAFGDLITGSITTGKASPDQNTAHHQLRHKQSEVEAVRYTSKSFTKGGK
jgi:hypothetical protein